MDIEELYTKQITAAVDERVARVRNAFAELQSAISTTRLTPEDFPEAKARGMDTSGAQAVMDYSLRRYLGPEVFKFVSDCAAAHARDLAAKASESSAN